MTGEGGEVALLKAARLDHNPNHRCHNRLANI
jgi:hypothetical protein